MCAMGNPAGVTCPLLASYLDRDLLSEVASDVPEAPVEESPDDPMPLRPVRGRLVMLQ
jgi:hypothetical protein